MANSKGSTDIRDLTFSGKHALLPPKSPSPTVTQTYTDFVSNNVIGSVQSPRGGNTHHLRTSSESFLIEEQPSWLDDLLNEPDTPVHRGGHRRSSSDSFAYIDVSDARNLDYVAQEYRYKNLVPAPSWASLEYDYHSQKEAQHAAFYTDVNLVKQKNRAWDSSLNAISHPSGLSTHRESTILQGSRASCAQKVESAPSTVSEKQDSYESSLLDAKASSEKKDNSSSNSDTKHSKQQFAQRSRVRKLQYIAELERNVQALQAEGSEISAEHEFLNQQNLILSMENKALKQRLENLAQEQLIKHFEHELLEREIGRLRALYHQQQQQQQHPKQQQQQQQHPKQQQQHQQQQHSKQQPSSSSSHRRSGGRDLDSQFSNLSLKHKDANSG